MKCKMTETLTNRYTDIAICYMVKPKNGTIQYSLFNDKLIFLLGTFSTQHTAHSTLYTPHFSLHSAHSIFLTPLCTLHRGRGLTAGETFTVGRSPAAKEPPDTAQILRYCTALYCTVLYCTALYCTALYCTVLHCTALLCFVLYCTALCSSHYTTVPIVTSADSKFERCGRYNNLQTLLTPSIQLFYPLLLLLFYKNKK